MFRRAPSRVVHPQGMAIYSHLSCKELGGGIRLISAAQYNTRRWFRWCLLHRDSYLSSPFCFERVSFQPTGRSTTKNQKSFTQGPRGPNSTSSTTCLTGRQGRRYVQNTRKHPKLHAALKVQPSKRAQKADALGHQFQGQTKGRTNYRCLRP